MPPIAEKVLAFDNLGPKYRVIVRIGLRSPGPQRLQDSAGRKLWTNQAGRVQRLGTRRDRPARRDPYDATGQMPDLVAAGGAGQARWLKSGPRGAAGSVSRLEALRKFFL